MRPASRLPCLALVLACQGYPFEEVTPKFLGAKTESHPVESKKLPPHLMLVVDRSGSMIEAADGSGGSCTSGGDYDPGSPVACKWNDLKRLLASDGGFLATNASIANFGLVLFAGDDTCGPGKIESYFGADSDAKARAAEVARLLDETRPKGGTPTALSLSRVLEDSRMHTSEPGRDRFVMLLTDGAPNCNPANDSLCTSQCRGALATLPATCFDPGQCKPTFPCDNAFLGAGCLDESGTVSAVKKLADRGIRTFVIGFGAATKDPASDAYRVLDSAAQAGGLARAQEPRFYQANSQDELSKALAALIEVVRQCNYTLSPPPEDPRLLEVAFQYPNRPEVVLATPGADAGAEWSWDAAKGQVKVTGARCDEIQSGPEGLSVVIRYVVGL